MKAILVPVSIACVVFATLSTVSGFTCPTIGTNETAYYPHETNCSRYYQCDNGIAMEMECPGELHWNENEQVCDHWWAAGCGTPFLEMVCPTIPPKPEDPPIHFPHESDCTKYYVCENGAPLERPCPDGLHWNAVEEVCDHPWAAGCATLKKPREPTCPIGPGNPEDPPIYHPHETDCQLYYVCSNGEAILLNCPHDLQWNNELQVCDHWWNVNCS